MVPRINQSISEFLIQREKTPQVRNDIEGREEEGRVKAMRKAWAVCLSEQGFFSLVLSGLTLPALN